MPWCGTTRRAVDRLPDATPGYAVHVVYVRAPGAPDRFGSSPPGSSATSPRSKHGGERRTQRASPRFDSSRLRLRECVRCARHHERLSCRSAISAPASRSNASGCSSPRAGFDEPEKAYLVYYDGSTGQSGASGSAARARARGFGSRHGRRLSRLLRATETDSLRPVVGIHELVHVLGAVDDEAPPCATTATSATSTTTCWPPRSPAMSWRRTCSTRRDDYYGHAGAWRTCRTRSSSSGSTRPTGRADRAAALVVGGDPGRRRHLLVARLERRRRAGRLSRVRGRALRQEVLRTSALLLRSTARQRTYSVRAVDAVGHLEPARRGPLQARLGVVDEQGRLLRDTVPPPAIRPRGDPRTTKTRCSRGRPCATRAAFATTGSRSAPGRSSSRSRR